MEMGDTFLTLMFSNMVAAMGSYFFVKKSDKIGRSKLFLLGWIVYAFCYFLFGIKGLNKFHFALITMFYGLFYALTDGMEKAMVADWLSADQKATGYGWLGLVQGVATFLANIFFGMIYEAKGPQLAFMTSASMAVIGVVVYMVHVRKNERRMG
jgi:MFS family permease